MSGNLNDTFLIAEATRPQGIHISARSLDDADDHELIDPTRPPTLLECVAGGLARQVRTLDSLVGLSDAEKAAEHYFLSGQRLDSLSWRRGTERYERLRRGESIQSE